ncbi:helix-turn-helix domain-containing protein [Glycomyces sp. L485]|uniref:helix-turn-helix domain-containing protein n=1 Tax=Glycomyces sp. L485 TaxID=2909235 RepID=UPI001F4AB773|nr:helix-turn-helix domain-containing protein [Glycomyces sp. L485]MCH7232359.1 helix-turn-helix domain-containing protein [Glycomyces sp. L485]
MTHLVKRGYEYTFRPDAQQRRNLEETLEAVRAVHNWSLSVFQSEWRRQEAKISYAEISSKLTKWKNQPANRWVKAYSSVPLQQIARQLHTEYHAFINGRRSEPIPKEHGEQQVLVYSRAGYYLKGRDVKLAKHAAPLAIDWGLERPSRDDITSITVIREDEATWKLRIVAEEFVEVPRQKPPECGECGRTLEE